MVEINSNYSLGNAIEDSVEDDQNIGPIVTGEQYKQNDPTTYTPISTPVSVPIPAESLPQPDLENNPLYQQLMVFPDFAAADDATKNQMMQESIRSTDRTIYENTGYETPTIFGQTERVQVNPNTGQEELVPTPEAGSNAIFRTIDDTARASINVLPFIDAPRYPDTASGAEHLSRGVAQEGAAYVIGSGLANAAMKAFRVSQGTTLATRATADIAGNIAVAGIMDDEDGSFVNEALRRIGNVEDGQELNVNIGQYADNQAFSIGIVGLGKLANAAMRVSPVRALVEGVTSRFRNPNKLLDDHQAGAALMMLRVIDPNTANMDAKQLLPYVEAMGNMMQRRNATGITAALTGDKSVITELLSINNFPETVSSQILKNSRQYVEEAYAWKKPHMSEAEWDTFVTNSATEVNQGITRMINARVSSSQTVSESATDINRSIRDTFNAVSEEIQPTKDIPDIMGEFATGAARPIKEADIEIKAAYETLEDTIGANAEQLDQSALVARMAEIEDLPQPLRDIVAEHKQGRSQTLFDAWRTRREAVTQAYKDIDEGIPLAGGEEGLIGTIRTAYGMADDSDKLLPPQLRTMLGDDWEAQNVNDLKYVMNTVYQDLQNYVNAIDSRTLSTADHAENYKPAIAVLQYIRGMRNASDNESLIAANNMYDEYAADFLSGSGLTDAARQFQQVLSGPSTRLTGEIATEDKAIRAGNKLWQELSADTQFLRQTTDVANMTEAEAQLVMNEFMLKAMNRVNSGDINVAELPQVLDTVADRMRALDEPMYTALREEVELLAASGANATTAREALDSAVQTYQNSVKDAQAGIAMNFMEKNGLVLPTTAGRDVPEAFAVRPEPRRALVEMFNSSTAPTQIRQYMQLATELDDEAAKKAMQSEFFQYTIDQYFSGKVINIGAGNPREASQFIADAGTIPISVTKDIRENTLFKSLNDGNPNGYFDTMAEVFPDEPEVVEAMQVLTMELYERIVGGKLTTNATGSNTVHNMQQQLVAATDIQQATRDTVLLAFGPLTREGSIVNVIARRLDDPEKAKAQAAAAMYLFDKVLTDVDFLRGAADIAKGELRDKYILDHLNSLGINTIIRPTAMEQTHDAGDEMERLLEEEQNDN